jgi:hypothetical protein
VPPSQGDGHQQPGVAKTAVDLTMRCIRAFRGSGIQGVWSFDFSSKLFKYNSAVSVDMCFVPIGRYPNRLLSSFTVQGQPCMICHHRADKCIVPVATVYPVQIAC